MKVSKIRSFLLLFLFFSYSVYAEVLPTKVKEGEDSIVQVYINSELKYAFRRGSGFFINQNTLVTNFHIIASVQGLFPKEFISIVQGDTSLSVTGIKAVSALHDIAILEVEDWTGPFLELGDLDFVSDKESYSIGFPNGQLTKMIGRNIKVLDQEYVFSTDAFKSLMGASGGPVLNKQGKVIGFVQAAVEPFLIAGKSNLLKDLLKQISESDESFNKEKLFDQAIKELNHLAEIQGDPYAQHTLGVMYSAGYSHPQNDKLAIKWWEEAAIQGHAMASYNLASMYFFGAKDVKKDLDKSIQWLEKADILGFLDAPYKFGGIYFKKKDYSKAAQWFKKAAIQGHPLAQADLGLMYSKGKGVPQNDELAAQWLKKAAIQGHPLAQADLGSILKAKESHRTMN